MPPSRPAPFVIVSTDHGTMIVNRNDHKDNAIGVGHQLLSSGSFDPQEIRLSLEILKRKRVFCGDGVVALDCGANIGTHSVEWGRSNCAVGSEPGSMKVPRIDYLTPSSYGSLELRPPRT